MEIPPFENREGWATRLRSCRRIVQRAGLSVSMTVDEGDFVVFSDEKRIQKLRYTHRNPVKRGLVESPEQWRWSSSRYYLLDEAGPVRVNMGCGGISFRDRVA